MLGTRPLSAGCCRADAPHPPALPPALPACRWCRTSGWAARRCCRCPSATSSCPRSTRRPRSCWTCSPCPSLRSGATRGRGIASPEALQQEQHHSSRAAGPGRWQTTHRVHCMCTCSPCQGTPGQRKQSHAGSQPLTGSCTHHASCSCRNPEFEKLYTAFTHFNPIQTQVSQLCRPGSNTQG